MKKIDDDLVIKVDNILFLLESKGKLGTIAIDDETVSKSLINCDPAVAKSKIDLLIQEIKTNASMPFNRTTLTRDLPQIHTAMSIRLMDYLAGQNIVTKPNLMSRVNFK